jgi:hypothetical protein
MGRAARLVFGSSRFWLVAALLAILYTLTSVLGSLGLAATFLSLLLTIPIIGYRVSIARSVLAGDHGLPSVLKLGSIMRRGLSAAVIAAALMVPLSVGSAVVVVVVLLGLAGLSGTHLLALSQASLVVAGFVVAGVAAVLMLVVALFVLLPALARYAAFDRLREGLRYRAAWQRFWQHRRPGLQLIGIDLAGGAILVALRYGAQWAFGLTSVKARAVAFGQLSHGLAGPGLALLAIDLALAILTGVWQLLLGGLLGQYVVIAFPPEQALAAESGLTTAST